MVGAAAGLVDESEEERGDRNGGQARLMTHYFSVLSHPTSCPGRTQEAAASSLTGGPAQTDDCALTELQLGQVYVIQNKQHISQHASSSEMSVRKKNVTKGGKMETEMQTRHLSQRFPGGIS